MTWLQHGYNMATNMATKKIVAMFVAILCTCMHTHTRYVIFMATNRATIFFVAMFVAML